MDAAHFHLLANHIPVIFTALGICLLLAGYVLRKEDLKKAALVIFFVSGALTIPVYLTGEGAEERVEDMPGVTDSFIHEHEEAAEPALIAALILGVLSGAGLAAASRKPKLYSTLVLAALMGSIFTEAVMLRTAYLGGQIRHTEIRPLSQTSQTALES